MSRRSREYKEALKLMGKLVVVSKKTERVVGEKSAAVWWEKEDIEPRVGWVMGIRWKQVGRIWPGGESEGYQTQDGWEPPEYEGPSFEQIGKPVPVLLVVFWPTEKPVLVPFDGYRKPCWGDEVPRPPKQWPIDDRVRKVLSEFAKEMPRDEKGRFVKEVKK